VRSSNSCSTRRACITLVRPERARAKRERSVIGCESNNFELVRSSAGSLLACERLLQLPTESSGFRFPCSSWRFEILCEIYPSDIVRFLSLYTIICLDYSYLQAFHDTLPLGSSLLRCSHERRMLRRKGRKGKRWVGTSNLTSIAEAVEVNERGERLTRWRTVEEREEEEPGERKSENPISFET